jgi:hypothetical protein
MAPHSLDRLLNVAAFSLSAYSGVKRTCKPFNSLMGETFELACPEKGFRFLAEKVCRCLLFSLMTAQEYRLPQEQIFLPATLGKGGQGFRDMPSSIQSSGLWSPSGGKVPGYCTSKGYRAMWESSLTGRGPLLNIQLCRGWLEASLSFIAVTTCYLCACCTNALPVACTVRRVAWPIENSEWGGARLSR